MPTLIQAIAWEHPKESVVGREIPPGHPFSSTERPLIVTCRCGQTIAKIVTGPWPIFVDGRFLDDYLIWLHWHDILAGRR